MLPEPGRRFPEGSLEEFLGCSPGRRRYGVPWEA